VAGVSAYSKGNSYERKAMDHLHAEGYHVWQTRGSKSPADLIAIKPGQLLLVQVKGAQSAISHQGWNDLWYLSLDCGTIGKPCLAIIADWPSWKPSKAGPIRLSVITGRHHAHSQTWPCEPFSTDLVGGQTHAV
jgi:hypothetical protein